MGVWEYLSDALFKGKDSHRALSASAGSPELGACLLAGDRGCQFRVWAPGAAGVEVTGDFCDDGQAYPLRAAGHGYWAGQVKAARVGQRYKFVLRMPDGRRLYRIDPAARDTLHCGLQSCQQPG